MNEDFSVLSEGPLHDTDFGEGNVSASPPYRVGYFLASPSYLQDQSVNVGWGSKSTQFHGSAGKTAAATVPSSILEASPDDDGMPRISWRGDGTFFAVSALSPDGNQTTRSHRTIRVYTRLGVLQSTSEPVHGLEHPLAWKPSGALIASTQRFWGSTGKEGRHDVVFFERNGLRHGDFRLRCWNEDIQSSSDGSRNWGYKIKDMLWSSDSAVLAIWIERNGGDTGLCSKLFYCLSIC